MAYTYKGTSITGTSTTAKVFKKSKVSNAKAGDTYLNTESGHVYRCTTAGDPDKAKWAYVQTLVIGKPKLAVKGLSAPNRHTGGSDTYTCKWTVPPALTKSTNGHRATSYLYRWVVGASGKDPVVVERQRNEADTADSFNMSSFTAGGIAYTRASFYPLTSKTVTSLSMRVTSCNVKGKGAHADQAITFKVPEAPKISVPTITAGTGATGTVSCTVTADAGDGRRERHDTRYIVSVENTRTKKTWEASNSRSTSTSFTLSYDAPDYQQLSYDEYIRITFKAWSRGYAGDSKPATRKYTISYPAQATISEVSVSSKASDGKATFAISTNSTGDHPVDQVRLEYLANSTYMTADTIPGDASWTETDIVDDAQCNALAMPVTNLIPDAGKRTWVRVKTYHAVESILYRYSVPVAVTALETPAATAADDSIIVDSASSGADGESAVIKLCWNKTGTDDSTGTELSWSADPNAWRSTNAPETYTFEWSDGQATHGTTTYHDSATITVAGLEEGEVAYIRARRYLEGERITYGPYTDTVAVIPTKAPRNVVLSVPTYVAAGSDITCEWTYGGGGTQRAWQLVNSSGTVVASENNAVGSYTISAARVASLATNNALTLHIEVATGSGFVPSASSTIVIAQAPALSLTVPSTVTAQPAAFTATSDRECSLAVVVRSNGSSGQTPTGIQVQPSGDTVYSGTLNPAWTEGNDAYSTTITLPSDLDLKDKASYTVEAVATDATTGLKSPDASGTFEVAWSHQAVAPSDEDVTLLPEDVYDDDGTHHQRVTITLAAPTGTVATDVYDLYRLTGDGAQLIGSGFPLTATTVDEYAPFGDSMTHSYRAAIRTVDGDVEYSDIEYDLDGSALRFDWPTGSLELPYNITVADEYDKDADTVQHLDGTTTAHYNESAKRKAKLSASLVRLDSQDLVDACRALGRYQGTVFVRTPDGSAYEADVQIDDMSTPGILQAVSITATELTPSSLYMLPNPYTEVIPDEEEEVVGGD